MHEGKNVKIAIQCNKVVTTTIRERLFNYLFMKRHSADRAQLLDKVGNYLLRLPPSHYEVAVTHA